jgi:hypothetical protein
VCVGESERVRFDGFSEIRLLLRFSLFALLAFCFPLATQPQQQRRNHTHDTPPTPQQPT